MESAVYSLRRADPLNEGLGWQARAGRQSDTKVRWLQLPASHLFAVSAEITMRARRGHLIGVYGLLLAVNAGAWSWAYATFGGNALLMGSAALAYGLGLRHAVDADHIAAIDNVTRKLVQQGDKPVAVGLYFSLGHSSVVALACGVIVATASDLHAHLGALRTLGGMVGTGVSAVFLLAIALANAVTLLSAWRGARADHAVPGGVLTRLLRPFVTAIGRSWQMYPLGFLFGLGFDTASEVGLLSVSATATGHVTQLWSIMVFPALFTAGMALIDTTDGVLMSGAYGWAMINPQRRQTYNLIMTSLSILVALAVCGLEVLDLAAQRFALAGSFWSLVGRLNSHSGAIGCAITAVLAGCWLLSALFARAEKARRFTAR